MLAQCMHACVPSYTELRACMYFPPPQATRRRSEQKATLTHHMGQSTTAKQLQYTRNASRGHASWRPIGSTRNGRPMASTACLPSGARGLQQGSKRQDSYCSAQASATSTSRTAPRVSESISSKCFLMCCTRSAIYSGDCFDTIWVKAARSNVL